MDSKIAAAGLTEEADGDAEAIREAIRLTSVPLYLRMVFSSLPGTFALEVSGDALAAPMPLAARQLIKLLLLQAHRRAFIVRDGGAGSRPPILRVVRGERRYEPSAEALGQGLEDVVRRFLEALLTPSEFSALTERFALQCSMLATLRSLTSYMLESDNVDRALYIMLSGITAGYALGFNRAILFAYDGQRGTFRGDKAIGPVDGEEAHRVWEQLEREDNSLEDLIRNIDARKFDTAFQGQIQQISFSKDDAPELFGRLMQSKAPFVVQGGDLRRILGGRLEFGREVIVAPLRPHGRLLAAVMADNLYSGTPFSADQIGYFGLFTDHTALAWENVALLKRVETLARMDALTGVFSRRELEARMAAEFARCRRHGRPCSMLVIDIDHFKEVNDSRGHAAGDELLRQLGAMLRAEVRADDVAGRFGGDEFVLILPEIDAAGALSLARRLGGRARALGISLSIGGASWPSPEVEAIDGLFARADSELYEVKRQGRMGLAFAGWPREHFGSEGE